MKRIISLVAAVSLAAQSAAAATYGAELGYTHLKTSQSRGQVQEYDGKIYEQGQGRVFLTNEGPKWLVDLDFRDIGTAEENGALFVDYGDSFKASAKYDRMTHRQNMTDFGIVINGVFNKIPPNLAVTLMPQDLNMQYKRTESEAAAGLYDSDNSARWLTVKHWRQQKKGSYPGSYYTGGILYFREANIDNETNEVTLGLGHDLGDKAAMSVDLVRRDFVDRAEIIKFNATTGVVKPAYPNTELTEAELKLRYDPSATLALTAALTGRQRRNLANQFVTKSGVAALNAAYKPGKTASLTARLYGRYVQVDENTGFRNFINGARPNTSQIDRLILRGDLGGTWRPVEPVLVKANYRAEMAHRRAAPSQVFAAANYRDGTMIALGQHANSVAMDEVKHILTAGVRTKLPYDAGLDLDYKRLQANRATFVNTPTAVDEAEAMLSVPLPGQVEVTLASGYLRERNGVQMTIYRHTRNTYRAGVDWAATNKAFLGADYSYDTARYNVEGWFGQSNTLAPSASGFDHIGGMYNRQNSTTAGLHGRVNLPKGVKVTANGSYTWSTVITPLNLSPRNDPGYFINDNSPLHVVILRGRVGVDYTPTFLKNLTAKASYRYEDWNDRIDGNNSGRVYYTQFGIETKF